MMPIFKKLSSNHCKYFIVKFHCFGILATDKNNYLEPLCPSKCSSSHDVHSLWTDWVFSLIEITLKIRLRFFKITLRKETFVSKTFNGSVQVRTFLHFMNTCFCKWPIFANVKDINFCTWLIFKSWNEQK